MDIPPGEQMKRWRLARKLTQTQLAEMVGVSRFTILRLERDPERGPDLATLWGLAGALGRSPASMLRLFGVARPAKARRASRTA